jgi:hypothetical protein
LTPPGVASLPVGDLAAIAIALAAFALIAASIWLIGKVD